MGSEGQFPVVFVAALSSSKLSQRDKQVQACRCRPSTRTALNPSRHIPPNDGKFFDFLFRMPLPVFAYHQEFKSGGWRLAAVSTASFAGSKESFLCWELRGGATPYIIDGEPFHAEHEQHAVSKGATGCALVPVSIQYSSYTIVCIVHVVF